jgi:hypothetical protein
MDGGGPAVQKPISCPTRTPRRTINQAIAFGVQPGRGRRPSQIQVRRRCAAGRGAGPASGHTNAPD